MLDHSNLNVNTTFEDNHYLDTGKLDTQPNLGHTESTALKNLVNETF